ncbi:MAG: hypothetical protein ACOC8Y_00390 [Candidatus Natronoplasma sp.]
MSEKKKIIGVVFITILILAVGMSIGDNTPKIRVTYQVVEDAQLSVNVEGVEEGNQLCLYDPGDKRVGSVNISSDDMTKRFIGVVQTTVELSIADEGNPEPGSYRMVIRDPSIDEDIYEDEITFEGPDIEIIDVELDTEYDKDLEEWEIISITIDLENEGDLSVFLDSMDLTIGEDESENIEFEQKFELIPDENTQVEENISIVKEEGDHSLNLGIYSYGEEIGTYDTEVTIG